MISMDGCTTPVHLKPTVVLNAGMMRVRRRSPQGLLLRFSLVPTKAALSGVTIALSAGGVTPAFFRQPYRTIRDELRKLGFFGLDKT